MEKEFIEAIRGIPAKSYYYFGFGILISLVTKKTMNIMDELCNEYIRAKLVFNPCFQTN